jgi:hypothetical protein
MKAPYNSAYAWQTGAYKAEAQDKLKAQRKRVRPYETAGFQLMSQDGFVLRAWKNATKNKLGWLVGASVMIGGLLSHYRLKFPRRPRHAPVKKSSGIRKVALGSIIGLPVLGGLVYGLNRHLPNR